MNDNDTQQFLAAFQQMTAVKFISDRSTHLLPQGPLTYPLATSNPRQRFYTDISLGLHDGYTATHAALQIAYYMGFQEVVIIGMSHRFTPSGRPNNPQHLVGEDTSHFSPNYFNDQNWDTPDL